MPRVTHFEIQASDPQTLLTFYQSLFTWKFQQWGVGWLAYIKDPDGNIVGVTHPGTSAA
jgi:predicted enzyme related to lactoylglutathione lyase